MAESETVPSLVIVNHTMNFNSKTSRESTSNLRSDCYRPTNPQKICFRSPEAFIGARRKLLSDISMMFKRQGCSQSARNHEPDASKSPCSSEASLSLTDFSDNDKSDREPKISLQTYPPMVKPTEVKASSSSWFLPLGRPLAAAPSLLLTQPGTAITKHEAVRKKRRRSWGSERTKNRRKVACSTTAPLVSLISSDEDSTIDAAVTLSKLGTATEEYDRPNRFAAVKGLPPPPFQLICCSNNRTAGRLQYPMTSFQLLSKSC